MTTELTTLSLNDSENVLKEIEDAFFDIPFENSAFQTENFVIAAQITPERAYRAIGLRMSAKLRALNEAKYGRMKEDADIGELQEKISDPNTGKWDRIRAEIDVQQKLETRRYTDKLINDALAELSILYTHLQKLPKFTREQFEQGERLHFEQRLQRQALGISGAKESLVNMHDDVLAIASFEDNIAPMLASTTAPSLSDFSQHYSDVNLIKQEVPPVK